MKKKESQDIREMMRKGYAKVAEGGASAAARNPPAAGVQTPPSRSVRRSGTRRMRWVLFPMARTSELGCGNPLAHAAIRESDTVLDLGSGAGFDCFLAAHRVGKSGKVIGVDMTPEMLARARENAAKAGITNVEFRLGEIEALLVAGNSVELIISNCVINLSPDKARVFSEAYRVLKPGGTLMVSDIVLERNLLEAVLSSVAAYVGCLAGAVRKEVYLDLIRRAGFLELEVFEETAYPIELMVNDPTAQAVLADLSLPKGELRRIGESVQSVKVRAVKPRS